LLTNHIVGTSPLSYMDFTPIASLFNDYVVFAVNANSPIKTGKDLIAKLKENPQSVSIGFATTLGSHNHIAAGLLAKSVGVNARNLKAIAFKGSSEAITQVLGGHIDMVTTAAGNVASHLAEGRLRVIGISSDKRFPGAFAQVPTWKEQGANLVYGGWRAIMGPKGLTPEQIAYWEGVLRKVTESPEWKADLEKNLLLKPGDTVFVPAAPLVYVSGEVKAPGGFAFLRGMTARQAISLAGGFTEDASQGRIVVVREVGGRSQEVKIKLDERLLPGDTVVVKAKLF